MYIFVLQKNTKLKLIISLKTFPFQGIPLQEYVIEITVFSWEDKLIEDKQDEYHLSLHPVYEDEMGDCYFRRTASVVKVSFPFRSILLFQEPSG